jgi:hypothetical protein
MIHTMMGGTFYNTAHISEQASALQALKRAEQIAPERIEEMRGGLPPHCKPSPTFGVRMKKRSPPAENCQRAATLPQRSLSEKASPSQPQSKWVIHSKLLLGLVLNRIFPPLCNCDLRTVFF